MDRIRTWLFAVIVMAVLGTGSELLLIEHTEEWTQLIPLVLMGLALVATALAWLKPMPRTVQLFRVVMGLFIVAGVVGIVLHYQGNAEFELEMRPTMAGLELIRESLMGATPALAPGSMIPIGLVGIIATFRHPALSPEPPAST